MNDKKTTLEKVDDLLDSVGAIEKVKVRPEFKQKVLDRLENQPSTVVEFLPWFTPKYQIAAILVFLFVNLTALLYYNSTLQNEKVESLANSYGVSTSENEISI